MGAGAGGSFVLASIREGSNVKSTEGPVLSGSSYMEHAAERDDGLPFRVFEKAHRRMKLAQVELAEAHRELDRAYEAMHKVGYAVRGAELADEIEARAPIGAERYEAEKAA